MSGRTARSWHRSLEAGGQCAETWKVQHPHDANADFRARSVNAQYWLLLPREGKKTVGHRAVPTSEDTFPNKRAARVADEVIEFYGAKLRVDVHNRYRSRLFGKRDIAVADERIVRLEEGGVECSVDTHLIRLRLAKLERGSEPPFSAFVGELPRRALKHFPVMLEYDRRARFVGLIIFGPETAQRTSARALASRRRSSFRG